MEEEPQYSVISEFPKINTQCKTPGKSLYFHVTNKISFIRWVGSLKLITCVEKPNGNEIEHILFYHQLSPAKLISIFDFSTSIRDLIVLNCTNKNKEDEKYQLAFITTRSLHLFYPVPISKVIHPSSNSIELPDSPTCLTAHPTYPLLLVGCIDGRILIINHSLQIVSVLKTHNAPLIKVICSKDVPHSFICCARGPSIVKMYSFLTNQLLNSLALHIFMTDICWNGNCESSMIVSDSFGYISVVGRRTTQPKPKKQATFQRAKLHRSGCNAVDGRDDLVFSGGDDGTAVMFDKTQFHLKRKKDGIKPTHVLVKVVQKTDGSTEILEDLDLEQNMENYVLTDDTTRVIDVKLNPEYFIIAIAVRKGVVVLKRYKSM
ncbi:hypothetical protein EHI8A_006540 [Entamoeba histolytica HM-1:IMSS-B]|uniref:WD domain containing protein n=6 Tax=Entamoeba histolytica TaxID=5759 RepID=C4LSB0_ENTH1|nr:hypothetical protein EHI_153180 [Entamoeba histolytica HM-1:IMSS]EMD45272.1 Hypothetical protein EHI5A_018690 [Entamoeba histolytica KU27]EMH74416.1 hypothetical protein EHI8A_006540 [Entamoeba histolytica HM-1:IMSS-B]ENY63986.1 hypothetical protein EHI7A_007310 [Entamoeba histolytica HM-1:IMSS-A]GAT91572.1 hypothetical protein CL6EHI_153180 [Entamoeba histolytica]EAL51012.1 hypothetical protein EHI_153180 [Entamoeba histolytica HM-1:IMSS]|eukprot:XP_656397.1 hypothetical protein EHI_153180 [Entamoeba histolytica HM-1:IMSS]